LWADGLVDPVPYPAKLRQSWRENGPRSPAAERLRSPLQQFSRFITSPWPWPVYRTGSAMCAPAAPPPLGPAGVLGPLHRTAASRASVSAAESGRCTCGDRHYVRREQRATPPAVPGRHVSSPAAELLGKAGAPTTARPLAGLSVPPHLRPQFGPAPQRKMTQYAGGALSLPRRPPRWVRTFAPENSPPAPRIVGLRKLPRPASSRASPRRTFDGPSGRHRRGEAAGSPPLRRRLRTCQITSSPLRARDRPRAQAEATRRRP
jgi:hypothetical protein